MFYTVELSPMVWKNVKNVPQKDMVKIKNKIKEVIVDLPDSNGLVFFNH